MRIEIGLTKDFDPDIHYVTDNEYSEQQGSKRIRYKYNLYKMDPDKEEATLIYDLYKDDVTQSVMKNINDYIGNIIQVPHLKMFGLCIDDFKFSPDYKEYEMRIEYKDLFMDSYKLPKFTQTEYDQCVGDPQNGGLYIQIDYLDQYGSVQTNNLNDYYGERCTLDQLTKYDNFYIAPNFSFDFGFSSNSKTAVPPNGRQQGWINENRADLESKGFDTEDLIMGVYLPIGKVRGTSMDAWKTVNEFRHLTRISIIEE